MLVSEILRNLQNLLNDPRISDNISELFEEKRCENNESVNDISFSSHNHSEIHFKAVEDRNTITDHDIKRNDVCRNINLKHPVWKP